MLSATFWEGVPSFIGILKHGMNLSWVSLLLPMNILSQCLAPKVTGVKMCSWDVHYHFIIPGTTFKRLLFLFKMTELTAWSHCSQKKVLGISWQLSG